MRGMSTTVVTPDANGHAAGYAIRRRIAAQIVADIFRGDAAAGSRLVVMKLAARFGVSSTPVRESLVELESVGLVRFMHNRGAVVKPFGAEALRQIFQLRRILETEATRCACGNIDERALSDLYADVRGLKTSSAGVSWSEREMDTDRRLHELIAASCGSGRLADEIRRYNMLVQAGREIVGNRRRAQERAVEEHLAILEGLIACDAQSAASRMARHIDSTGNLVEAVMFHGR
jgi:DNA-binding GntR family transcriptional regulator